MNTGKCFWITGLPGAGKTTFANKLITQLAIKGIRIVRLDGDELREIFGKLGKAYDSESRRQLAFTYAKFCNMLLKQDFSVVCATVSMFDDVRSWNKENIPGYVEIFLDPPESILKARDQKGLYSNNSDQLPGYSQHAELPKSPHYHVKFEEDQNIDNIIDTIIRYEYVDVKFKRCWE